MQESKGKIELKYFEPYSAECAQDKRLLSRGYS